jgi:hypothetical protein
LRECKQYASNKTKAFNFVAPDLRFSAAASISADEFRLARPVIGSDVGFQAAVRQIKQKEHPAERDAKASGNFSRWFC